MDCFYCEHGEKLAELMTPVCELQVSHVYLVKNQNFPGRCVVVFKEHKKELFELTASELHAFSEDTALVAQAINDLYKADKINYGIFGDGVPHLHYHIIPKKKDALCWGGQFDMNASPAFPHEEELTRRAKELCAYMEALGRI